MELHSWIHHFRQNGTNRPEPSWDLPVHLYSPREKAPLLRSLSQFQLGDGGGPAYLIGRDLERYFSRYPEMKTLVDLWFHEEERHSALLEKAVRRLDGVPITNHWSFSVFCGVRRLLGVKFELYALLLTEITSNNYYKLLRKYGRDRALIEMADLIIRDETGHIAFHRDRIASDRDGRYPLGVRWSAWIYLLALAAGTMLWINHRSAIVRLGGSTPEFYRGFLGESRRFIATTRRRRRELRWKNACSSRIAEEDYSANIGSSGSPCDSR